jgi:hypothetical protein
VCGTSDFEIGRGYVKQVEIVLRRSVIREVETDVSDERQARLGWAPISHHSATVHAAGGYHVCLDQLRVLLDTRSAPSLVESDEAARRLQSEYAKQLVVG